MKAARRSERVVRWRPQPGPQAALVTCPAREILFGGARGGGKTSGVLGRVGVRAGWYGRHYNAVIFRREMPQADDMIEEARQLYEPIAKFNGSSNSFRFRNGARLRFRPLERLADAQKYQGQNLTECIVEEAGNYPTPDPILRLFAALRSKVGVPTALCYTANPGGPGQQWIRERFRIETPDSGWVPIVEQLAGGLTHTRIFIPSRIADNRILLANDPHYIANLHLVGSRALVRAWLDGDWGAVEGAYFDCWDESRHVIRPFELPPGGLIFRSMDWGSARPFSVGWWYMAANDIRHPVDGRRIPRGALIRFREWYGCEPGKPNTGLKLTAGQVAAGIVQRTPPGEPVKYTVADPAMFAEDGGPSLAERMTKAGVPMIPADNTRVGTRGAVAGWDLMRARMLGDADGDPMVYCFTTCRDSRRTIPALQHDQDRPEDLDSEAEDHAADDWRYAISSRPWQPPRVQALKTVQTFADITADQPDGRKERI